ncbi:hypothetical protein SUGI_0646480 [Cryptomeria japonica]|nr:hypothetical protein SUGI_0646480 [Cryptomeria japonica]
MYWGSLVKKKKNKKVQVIFPNGELRPFDPPITICELLLQYPHHYCVPHVKGSNLTMNDELVGGNTYLLLPLPRLGINSSLRRAKSWEPSLGMIAEINAPLQGVSAETKTPLQKNKVDKTLGKHEKKVVNMVEIKPTYSLNRRAWDTGRAKSMEYMAPSALIF